MDAAAIVYNAVDSDRRAKGQAMTTTRRRRTKEEARDEILSAAAKRLLDDGPDALRIADVAADVGMSHPTLLHHVGSREQLAVTVMRGIRPTWTEGEVRGTWRGLIQYRAHGAALPAGVSFDGQEVRVELEEPTTGVAPGQSAVFYDGDRVVGSATVAEAFA